MQLCAQLVVGWQRGCRREAFDTTQFVSQPKLTGAATTATTSSAAAATADAATLARIVSRCAQRAQQSDVVSQPQGVRCPAEHGFETIGQNDRFLGQSTVQMVNTSL
jgi:hypothetical protein